MRLLYEDTWAFTGRLPCRDNRGEKSSQERIALFFSDILAQPARSQFCEPGAKEQQDGDRHSEMGNQATQLYYSAMKIKMRWLAVAI